MKPIWLFLQKGIITKRFNAKVTLAQVQLPDGSFKSIAMIYDATGKALCRDIREAAATGGV
jgi:hypothetical protein